MIFSHQCGVYSTIVMGVLQSMSVCVCVCVCVGWLQLMALAEKSESLCSELVYTDHLLSSATQLINTLIRSHKTKPLLTPYYVHHTHVN